MIGPIIASTGNRVYARTDARKVKAIPPFEDAPPEAAKMYQSFPEQFRFRMPGVANEFWAIEDSNPGGCENYGWGATLPMLIIRNVVGFRELDNSKENAFRLGPSLPKEFLKAGESYGITNLRFRTTKSDVQYEVTGEASLKTKLTMRGQFKEVMVRDGSGAKLASAPAAGGQAVVSFPAVNGKVYTVHVSV
jgi:hypothetical protein